MRTKHDDIMAMHCKSNITFLSFNAHATHA